MKRGKVMLLSAYLGSAMQGSQTELTLKEDMEYDRKLNALLGDNALGTFGETKVQKPHRLEVVIENFIKTKSPGKIPRAFLG